VHCIVLGLNLFVFACPVQPFFAIVSLGFNWG
jgi:hypothetical protein